MPISQFKNGQRGKIVGKLDFFDAPLISPLTGRECSYYHVVIKEHRRRGKSSSWVTIIDERRNVDFMIQEGEYSALVSSQNIQGMLVKDGKFKSGTFNDATPHLNAFLERHGRSSTGMLGFNKSLKYHEGILEKGEEVAVLGTGMWENSESKVLLVNADQEPVYVSDHHRTKN